MGTSLFSTVYRIKNMLYRIIVALDNVALNGLKAVLSMNDLFFPMN